MRKVTVIIPVWNELEKTKKCLDRLIFFTDSSLLEIVVVDNGSDRDSRDLLNKYDDNNSNFTVISNVNNEGFVKGVNIGLSFYRENTPNNDVVLLNNDAYVSEGWLEAFTAHLDKYDIIGPLSTAKHQWQYVGNNDKPLLPRDVNSMVAFFCVYLKKEVIDKVGYLDDAFGVGLCDDDDYCLMAMKEGFKIGLIDFVIEHDHRTSISKIEGIDRIQIANMRYFRKKHNLPKKVMIAIPNLGNIRVELVSFLLTLKSNNYQVDVHFSCNRPCSHNRNLIVDYFLAHDHDYLVQIDSDICPPANILEILDDDVDIVSPVMYAGLMDNKVSLGFSKDEDGYKPIDFSEEETGLKEVAGVGSGCLCVKREVFEKMTQPYFFRRRDKGKAILGHDLNFCDKSIKFGFKVFYNTKFVCKHYQITGF